MADAIQSILPASNSTPWERAIERVSAERWPELDYDIIRRVKTPWECPEHLLPFLAHELSVDIWDDNWSTQKKRSVIARSIRLHRLKGTAAGMRKHVELAGGKVTQLITPPQGLFLSGTLGKEGMDAWLRTMPQIRIYMTREKGSGQGITFLDRGFLDHGFLRFDAARAIYGRAARLWDGGQEVPLRQSELTTVIEERQGQRIERVSLPGDGRGAAFFGRLGLGFDFFGKGLEAARLATYRQSVSYEHSVSSLSLRSVHPGFAPVDVRSERISGTGHAGAALHFGRFFGWQFYASDRAGWMMYDRIVLHDPARAAPRVAAWSFFDFSRFGLPAYTAKSVIDPKTTALRGGMYLGSGFFGVSQYRPEDRTKQKNIEGAVRVSKAARDRHLLTHKLTRPMRFGDGIPLDGSIRFDTRLPFRL